MYQAYDRPKTPSRFDTRQQPRHIETSPFKQGQPNNRYANPSLVSNDVFYEKHYDDPRKQLTPPHMPLGVPTKGYGKMTDYKDRFKQISGQADQQPRTPARSDQVSGNDQQRSDLRDQYRQKSRASGAQTPARSQQTDQRLDSGARTPTRRVEADVADLKATGHRTPSDWKANGRLD